MPSQQLCSSSFINRKFQRYVGESSFSREIRFFVMDELAREGTNLDQPLAVEENEADFEMKYDQNIRSHLKNTA